jgi:hypothetical protein
LQNIRLYTISLLLWLVLIKCTNTHAQDSISITTFRMASADTIATVLNTKKNITANTYTNRKRLVGLATAGIYGGTLYGLNKAWYANYKRSSFHSFNDNKEWLQIDKVGHGWSAYQLSRLSYGAWNWSGVRNKKAVLYAGLSGPGFLTVIEILDGFSDEWGWSWGDMAANVFGGGLFVAQQLGWQEQRIDFKFSVHRNNYSDPMLTARANKIYGNSLAERFLKDYNGQTYWLSANLKSFFKNSNIPKWLNVSVGYGIEGVFGANQNLGTNAQGVITFDRRDLPRQRQWYLTPDIKWSKLKTKSKFVKSLFYVLDGIKFPMPGIELSNGQPKLKALIF